MQPVFWIGTGAKPVKSGILDDAKIAYNMIKMKCIT